MRKAFAPLLMLGLASCATTSPSSTQWSKIEGCWTEHWADHWPASMTWRRDPENPQRYLGVWQREAAQGDMERASFVLMPSGDYMQLCMQMVAGSWTCDRAVFGRQGWHQDSVAVFDVNGMYHEFGYAGASAPLFWGNRGSCG